MMTFMSRQDECKGPYRDVGSVGGTTARECVIVEVAEEMHGSASHVIELVREIDADTIDFTPNYAPPPPAARLIN